ncbi:MAG: hypothetical protein EZS28_005832 [Streblomastix strix]|uniref:Uncharacterized protein n=1 Tax=Streblomastix strix TaxID=222440 RepID=A0A5J4WWF6_9EUKA|nr:MAG: hypothetical protein EZS28_005832 [Streblomastix strix]
MNVTIKEIDTKKAEENNATAKKERNLKPSKILPSSQVHSLRRALAHRHVHLHPRIHSAKSQSSSNQPPPGLIDSDTVSPDTNEQSYIQYNYNQTFGDSLPPPGLTQEEHNSN